ncbi:MAG: flagellar basal-body rod protein FlgG [Calditrichaeota bacterium]|nr:flagellar basal-body rod protein FlgG [Calditrichota bacterium]
MLKSLSTAASGMTAQELAIDNIANNLANVNTTGFKRSRVEFQDLIYQMVQQVSPTTQGTETPTGLQIGGGTRAIASVKDFDQGDPLHTGNSLDLMIRGDGFFEVLLPDGQIAYTRDGSWKLSSEGKVVNADGLPMEPPLDIPEDATAIMIDGQGLVLVRTASTPEPTEIGQIELARFVNPAGLESLGKNLYAQTVASGEPVVSTPGKDGLGTIDQGYLENSNVRVVEEMINLIAAQRAYELNSKAVQTAQDMLGIAANLKR